ncbi:cyclophilin peptidyl-prolyl cis-trans isomerase Cyp8 [Tilletia horrida]|uniref:Cyclophilin peptidyl-prolyl cis-trans isomerase Cyp8 n=1 Tax=Tilletia horrida TaxID=155126 RepID=A0AAN6GJK3_9BASI|nr:cyclophilin peptidyl-prolyl cis-trans isomerase Cyp8 [Tilletia horrida]KAK0538330.1 cyclophilin peptidyl-prolyl cis-trans isomerase Cyp8 [Tilletia horrida]
MGHNKSTNALYVRASEHQAGASGASAGAGAASAVEAAHGSAKFQQLPFNCCAISLQPWEHPVCARGEKTGADGKEGLATIFDLANVLPFIKKFGGVNPATGGKLSAEDLIPLHFTEREAASSSAGGGFGEVEYVDPVSFKLFNEHTHLVAIKPTGNVYAWETVERLNLKAKHLRDLLTDEPFTRADIIHLQDPANIQGRDVSSLHHVRAGMVLTEKDRGIERVSEVNLGATSSSAAKLLETIRAKTQKPAPAGAATSASKLIASAPAAAQSAEADSGDASASASTSTAKQPYNVSHVSTNRVAAAFTSSGLTPTTQTERRMYDEDELMFDQVAKGVGLGSEQKGKGGIKAYVRLTTNFGPLNLELHVDKAPKTCYNFLTHVRDGYYNDTIFHRNIPGFMIQGGDPTGTGRGGESIWGQPFRDELDEPGAYRHTERGTLSMANKGPGTNGSQFFITYRPTPHLDKKHTVFGHLVNSTDAELSALERVPTEPSTNRPLRSIRILEASVFEDPFERYKDRLEKKLARENMSAEERAERDRKRKWKEEDRVTWLGTNLGAKDAKTNGSGATGLTSASQLFSTGSKGVSSNSSSDASASVGKYLGASSHVAATASPIAARPGTAERKKAGAGQSGSLFSGADFGGGIGLEPASKKKKKGGGFGDFEGW